MPMMTEEVQWIKVDTVNIYSFSFSSIHSVIIAKLKLAIIEMTQYYNTNFDMGSDSNIMPHIISKFHSLE